MENTSEFGGHGLRLLIPAPPSAAAVSGGAISMLSMDEAWKDICLSPSTATTSGGGGGYHGGRSSFFPEDDPATVLRLRLNSREEERGCSWSSKVSIPTRKRVHQAEVDNISSHDHGLKKLRLIRSRESAAKARARKQAYIDELEARMKRLKKENAELRKQCVEAAAECPKKHTLSRALTAPF